jgi:N-acetylmuramoyl-L-alanine amidase
MSRTRGRGLVGQPVLPGVGLLTAVLMVTGCGSIPDAPAPAPSPTAPITTPAAPQPAPRSGTPTATPSRTRPPRQPVIVIDPGHSGRSIRSTDRSTGLKDIDYPNYPEIYEMFDVSVCVAQALRADGYRVLLTKEQVLDSVSHADRAAVANRSRADLALSVHDDHGVSERFEATYDQRGIAGRSGRYPEMYRGSGRHRTVFAHPEVARRSQAAARTIARERSRTQQRRVRVTQNSYNGRAPLEPGNLALVQLFSDVPWVYNEMGALTAGNPQRAMSIASERRYAAGLVAGVEAAVPLPGRAEQRSTNTTTTLTRCLEQQVEPEPGKLTRPHRYLPAGFR